jgi:diguanylate cyclase (GGDEF)-like protein
MERVAAGLRPGKFSDCFTETGKMAPSSETMNQHIRQALLMTKLRWFGLFGFVLIILTMHLVHQSLPAVIWLFPVGGGVYNILATWYHRQHLQKGLASRDGELRLPQNVLFALDIALLSLAVYLLGFSEFYLLPLAIIFTMAGALMLARRDAFLQAAWASALLWVFLWLNNLEQLRLGSRVAFLGRLVSEGWVNIGKVLVPGSVLIFFGVYLVSVISSQYNRILLAERKARQQAEILHQMGVVLSSTLEQEQLLGLVLKYLMKLVACDSSSIMLIQGKKARVVAARGGLKSSHILPSEIDLPGDSLFQEIVDGHRYILIQDAASDPRLNYLEGMDSMRSCICVPLVAHSTTVGLLTVGSAQPDLFQEKDAALVQSFAGHVALALDNARLYREMRHSAHTDGLTGLYNRRYLHQELERELARSRRYGHPLSLIICDLDNFKKYNDQYGHLAGDDLLRELGDLMKSYIRKSDTAFRYGGEEFALILPHTDQHSAVILSERLREAISSKSFMIREKLQIGHVTISIGVASCPEDATEVDSLINTADMALYEAKKTKNRVCTRLPLLR